MRKRIKALVLTASYGDGHIQVARSLEQALRRNGIEHVSVLDLLKEAHPVMDAVAKFVYDRSLAASSYGLHYYGWSYYLTRDIGHGSLLARWLNDIGVGTLLSVIERERPDAIVSTFPFGGIASHIRRRGLPVPTFTVITDFALHNRWIHSASDRFYVATEDLKHRLVRRGVAEQRIRVSGIPIRDAFTTAHPESGTPHEPEQRQVLFMAGTCGLWREVRGIVRRLLLRPDVRIVTVCGRNGKLMRRLDREFRREPNLTTLGYVDRIDELMRGSDCIITKAGGVTLSEAIHVNVPIFVYKPIPGQEKENALYLEQKGAALVSDNVRQLAGQVNRLLDDRDWSNRFYDCMRSLRKEHAAESIARDIVVTVEGRGRSDGSIA
ncbi:MGDG synthase family glycosyltransferase [Paenibacillus flagellatus]|uniref:MGDG synthase family glycosyltransferase n=1 Tax=Paenibacillus flagellatus TaxID=2211139 RepID=UPI0013054543|nr:glycosyltransferase [Paenibacillus flagellatus]